jgi:hypothetical protein
MYLVTIFIRALRSSISPMLFWGALMLFAYYVTANGALH